MRAPDVETVVIGAGVVGLAIARALVAAGHEVMVLERHDAIGQETSSRSSEVVHAGLYYPPGSLKARLCVEGRELLASFARENGVPFVRTGKLVVATADDALQRLSALAETARLNGVGDVTLLSQAEACALEPALRCTGALLSPSTGVIDSPALMLALEGHVRAGGGSLALNTAVTGLATRDGGFAIETESAGQRLTLTARRLVISAGLGASRLGALLPAAPGYAVPRTYPARGHYFTLAGRAPFQRLIYPLPGVGFLGIHLTLDVAGGARFGPDVAWHDTPSTAFDDPDGARRATFEREIRRYWPGLDDGRLSPGYVGVRPKIYRAGEPVADFAIHTPRTHGLAGLVALYGIESPGLTSSLAIGAYVARHFELH